MEFVTEVIGAVRSIRSMFQIPHTTLLDAIVFAPDAERTILEETQQYLLTLSKMKKVLFQKDGDPKPHHSALTVVGTTMIYVPLESYIDVPKEVARLEKEIGQLAENIGRIDGRLRDDKFLKKADPLNVQEDRERAALLREQQETLKNQIALLAS